MNKLTIIISASLFKIDFHIIKLNSINQNQLVMEKQSSNQVLIKEASPVIVSNRNLVLQSEELNYYLKGYEQWLRVLGYTNSTVYYFPVYLRSFFYFLEKHSIQSLRKLRSAHIRQFLCFLSRRPNMKTGNPLSKNYLLNHLNAIKRFSRYLSDCHKFILDSSVKVTIGTPVNRKCLTIEEVKKLYKLCDLTPDGMTNRAILSVYYGLGLRRSEGTGLDISDILSSEGVVYVRKGKFNKERYVPMTDAICSDLQKYINEVRSMLVTYRIVKNRLYLKVTSTTEIEGGHTVRSTITTLSDSWEIVGGKEKVVKQPGKEEEVIEIQRCNNNILKEICLVLDGRKYYKMQNDPTKY